MLLDLHIYNVQHLIKSLHRHEVMSFSLATMSFLLTGYVPGHNGAVHSCGKSRLWYEHECLWCLRKLRQLYNIIFPSERFATSFRAILVDSNIDKY